MVRFSRFHALVWIALSTGVISGGAVGGWKLWSYWKGVRQTHPHYTIREIYQTGSEQLALPSEYLAEVLDLSVDRPTNLHALDLEEAHEQLLSSPWIREARLKKLPPSTLYIDYEVRDPIATLSEGMGIDLEGRWFPLAPFLKDCGLPRLAVADPAHTYHALNLLHLLSHRVEVRFVDVTRLASPNVGEREVRVELASGRVLRLPCEEYEAALGNYFALEPHLSSEQVVDLRIPHLAYLTTSI
jgi:cell division septal protein FtsQ